MRSLFKLYIMLQKNNNSDSSGLGSNNLIIGIIGVVIACLLGLATNKFGDIIELIGGVKTILLLAGAILSVGILGFGVITLINKMYMASDIEIIITMPFSSIQVAILRVLSFYQLALAASILFILAPCIGYATVCPVSAKEWLSIIVTSIMLPTFVTALSAAMVILIMRVLKVFQSRETLKVIGAVLMFFVMCGYLFFSSNSQNVDMQAIMITVAGKIEAFKYVMPNVAFAIDFISKGNLLFLAGDIICTVAAVGIFFVIAKGMYLQGAMSMQDAGRGKALSEEDLDKYCQKKTALNSLIMKEYRLVRRNPVYMVNNFIIGALWPILIIILFKQMLPMIQEGMKGYLMDSLCGPISFDGFAIGTTLLTLFALTVVSFPLSMQSLAFSSLSREGSSFMIMKQIPVSYDIQIEAKRRMARNVAQITTTGYLILILIAASIILKFPIIYIIIPILMTALYTEYRINADMSSGIKHTNVNWDDEKTAINKPVLLSLIGSLSLAFYMFITIAVFMLISEDKGLIPYGLCVVIGIGVILFALNMLFRHLIKKNGEKKIRKLRF